MARLFMKPFVKAYLKKQRALYISDLKEALSDTFFERKSITKRFPADKASYRVKQNIFQRRKN